MMGILFWIVTSCFLGAAILAVSLKKKSLYIGWIFIMFLIGVSLAVAAIP